MTFRLTLILLRGIFHHDMTNYSYFLLNSHLSTQGIGNFTPCCYFLMQLKKVLYFKMLLNICNLFSRISKTSYQKQFNKLNNRRTHGHSCFLPIQISIYHSFNYYCIGKKLSRKFCLLVSHMK